MMSLYSDITYESISGRFVPPYLINSALKYFEDVAQIDIIGSSVLGKPISCVTLGTGNFKILGWSQMHGNESTTTKALLDLLNTFKISKTEPRVKEILEQITLKVVLQLNPDGAEAYTRFNVNGVDLNRDAKELTQPESRALRALYDNFKPDLCLNLHDQRTIYNIKDTEKTAIVSFLAPSADVERSITDARKIAMQYIASMGNGLEQEIPGYIGRYDDGFNINCVGDMFQSLGTPTILFEAGHYPKDYKREKTREYIYKSLLSLLKSCVSKDVKNIPVSSYFQIPENDKMYADLIVRKARIGKRLTDVLIQYNEQLIDGKLHFVPLVVKIGDLPYYLGHRTIMANSSKLYANHDENIEEGLRLETLTIGENVVNFLKYS